ncbi:hypothetical protein [Amycolatopsis sp. NPDC051102]|uniref:hypothetical protein n=1 Tax=Amycolatopsis sp. NPDC051102 TaxID=3155163 RepID=UPI0034319B81
MLAVGLNGALTVLRIDPRVIVNRSYEARMLAAGWNLVTSRGASTNSPIDERLGVVIDEVQSLLSDYSSGRGVTVSSSSMEARREVRVVPSPLHKTTQRRLR